MRPPSRPIAWCAAALIAVYFLTLAAPGLTAYFNPDDTMNLYPWWASPITRLFKANVLFFSPEIRPLGGAYYLALFSLAGFHAGVFAAARFALLGLNLWIAYRLARQAAGSREAGALAALAFAYHGCMADLYASTGTIYDILCFALYYSALLVYLRDPRRAVVVTALLIAALNAKEMAVTLPAVMLMSDSVCRRRVQWRTVALAAGVTALFLAGKFAVKGPLSDQPAYIPVLTVTRVRDSALSYLNQLFYAWPGGAGSQAGWFGPLESILLMAVAYAAARLLRSRAMKFGWWLAVLTVSPLLVALPRPGYALYLPMLGCAIYGAALLLEVRARLGKFEIPVRAAFFIAVAVALLWVHLQFRHRAVSTGPGGHRQLRAIADEFAKRVPAVPPKSRILFLGFPFDDHTLYEFTQLYYRDQSLEVRSGSDPASLSGFDYAFEWREGGVHILKPAALTSLRPFVRLADADAADHFVKDIVRDRHGGAYGWTYETPELKFRVNPDREARLAVDFIISDSTFRQTGPVRIDFLVNGNLAGTERYTRPGEVRYRAPVPRDWLDAERTARVEMRIAPPFVAPGDGAKLGIILLSAGFLP